MDSGLGWMDSTVLRSWIGTMAEARTRDLDRPQVKLYLGRANIGSWGSEMYQAYPDKARWLAAAVRQHGMVPESDQTSDPVLHRCLALPVEHTRMHELQEVGAVECFRMRAVSGRARNDSIVAVAATDERCELEASSVQHGCGCSNN